MSYLEDELKIKIDDVDDVVKVWIKNKDYEFKHLKELDAIYQNGIHGLSKGNITNVLTNSDNYIIIGSFNKVFNGTIKLKFLPCSIAFKGGKTSYAISFYINNEKIWSHFKYISDYEIINYKLGKKRNLIGRLSNYFGNRTKEEENAIIGLKYYHIFKIKVEDKRIYFNEVYREDLIYNKKFQLKTFDNEIKNNIWKRLVEINEEFINNKTERYADTKKDK